VIFQGWELVGKVWKYRARGRRKWRNWVFLSFCFLETSNLEVRYIIAMIKLCILLGLNSIVCVSVV